AVEPDAVGAMCFGWIYQLLVPSFPCGAEKAIRQPCLPDVPVAGGGELVSIARHDPCAVRQVVVQPRIQPLCVDQWQAIAERVVATPGLLELEDGFKVPTPASLAS